MTFSLHPGHLCINHVQNLTVMLSYIPNTITANTDIFFIDQMAQVMWMGNLLVIWSEMNFWTASLASLSNFTMKCFIFSGCVGLNLSKVTTFRNLLECSK